MRIGCVERWTCSENISLEIDVHGLT